MQQIVGKNVEVQTICSYHLPYSSGHLKHEGRRSLLTSHGSGHSFDDGAAGCQQCKYGLAGCCRVWLGALKPEPGCKGVAPAPCTQSNPFNSTDP